MRILTNQFPPLLGKVNSLVNPQLDDFRKVMFNPVMYSTWEKLMISTGLANNQIFPVLLITLFVGVLSILYNVVQSFIAHPASSISTSVVSNISVEPTNAISIAVQSAFILVPLSIALWGASLFKPGNQGAGFAQPGNAAKRE